MLDTPFEIISSVIVWIACAIAMALGGRPERIGAAAIWLAWLLSVLTQGRSVSGFLDPQYAWIYIDGALFLALTWLALRSGRKWPTPAAACQALMLGTHVAMGFDLAIRAYAYLTAIAIWSLGVLIALVVGVFTEAEAERRRVLQAQAGTRDTPA